MNTTREVPEPSDVRARLLRDLIEYRGDPARLLEELRPFGFDSEEELVVVKPRDVRRVIGGFVHNELAAAEVEAWADAIEVRDDVGFDSDAVRDAVFVLAHPEIEGPLHSQIDRLRRSLVERHPCPACGYELWFEPWRGDNPSDEICPSCGIQFGYTDAVGGDLLARTEIHARWREQWIKDGSPWRGAGPAPLDWNAEEQLRRVTDG